MEPQRSKWRPFNRETFFHFNILCLCLGMALVALILQEQKPEEVVHTLGALEIWGKRLDEALLILLILLPFNWLLRWFYER